MQRKACDATIAVHKEFLEKLPFDEDCSNLEDTRRGLLAETPDLAIRNETGDIVFNAAACHELLQSEHAPETVNPSLWRHQRLECVSGLFEVTDGIWQVRGYDVSNLTLIRGKNGYIIVDSMHSPYTARAAMRLAFEHLPKKPVTGVVITHCHADHFGGLEGAVSRERLLQGDIPIVAPQGFAENTLLESIFVGRGMMRRGPYQFGQKLPIDACGNVGVGLGITCARTQSGFVMPNKFISKTGEKLVMDGVEFIFEMAPETEAPAEFCFYLPQFSTLCMAELINSLQHNLLPIRGAQARSARNWAHFIEEAIVMFGDSAEVLLNTHGWPVWGKENILHLLEKQRDLYKFINDQTVRGINHGLTMNEIAEEMQLPPALYREWSSRDYYGHLKHNVKATYQRYLGWYDCNPAHLDPLPPEEESRRYVDFMGGPEIILEKAEECFKKGEFRWAATVLNHLVFANPENTRARKLLARVYEQLAYQSECSAWRNSYLTGAKELLEGPGPEDHSLRMSKTAFANMPTEFLLDYLAVTLEPARAEGKDCRIHLFFTDREEKWTWILKNSVLNAWNGHLHGSKAQYKLSRDTFDQLARGELGVDEAISQGLIAETGEKGMLAVIFASFEDRPNFNFGIVTP